MKKRTPWIVVIIIVLIGLFYHVKSCAPKKEVQIQEDIEKTLNLPHGLLHLSERDLERIDRIRNNFNDYKSALEMELKIGPEFLRLSAGEAKMQHETILMLLSEINTTESAELLTETINNMFDYLEPEWKTINDLEAGRRKSISPAANKILGLVHLGLQNMGAMNDSSFTQRAFEEMETVDTGTRRVLLQYLVKVSNKDTSIIQKLRYKIKDSESKLYQYPMAIRLINYYENLSKNNREE